MLMPDDFRAFSKVRVDNQSFNKENLPSHFKVSINQTIFIYPIDYLDTQLSPTN